MIGSDEFNFRSSQPVGHSMGDINDMEYIETFLSGNSSMQSNSRLLIDIVCPQPQSKRRQTVSAASQRPTVGRTRTNSSNNWRK